MMGLMEDPNFDSPANGKVPAEQPTADKSSKFNKVLFYLARTLKNSYDKKFQILNLKFLI
jgi:hypothetical protein